MLQPWIIHHYEQLSSTMDQAIIFINDPLTMPNQRHVISATLQTQGRGRHQRFWQSIAGNIFISLVISPAQASNLWSQLTFIASLGVHGFIQGCLSTAYVAAGSELILKWPNDVLLNGAKIAGILLEIHTNAKGQSWIIIGIGINITSSPQNLAYSTTFVHDHTLNRYSHKDYINNFLACFDNYYDIWCAQGFKSIKDLWLDHSPYQGHNIEIDTGSQRHRGQSAGIDEQGRITILTPEKILLAFAAGDIKIL